MSKISMRGYDNMDELCAALPLLLDRKVGKLRRCRLLESTRRGSSAFMLFLCHYQLVRGEWPFAVSVCADGEALIVDVMSGGRVFDSYSERLLELTAEILRERGFAEYEREGWSLESDRTSAQPEPAPLSELHGGRCAPVSRSPVSVTGQATAEPEKRGYDPEI